MIIREDVDIGHVVIRDVHKKSRCAELRLGEAIDVMSALRRTQLDLVHCGLGLQEPKYDIMEDVLVTHTLVGEFTKTPLVDGLHTPRGFVAEVEDAMRCEERPTRFPSKQLLFSTHAAPEGHQHM